ncbi:MAG: PAS domain S-box protein [Granulosicoccus sp.]
MSIFGKQQTAEAAQYNQRMEELDGVMSALEGSHAIIEFAPDGTIVTANPNFLSATGYTLKDIQGKNHRMLMPAEELKSPAYAKFWSQLRKGQHFSQPCCRVRKSGQKIWLQASYCPVLDASGKVVKIMKLATDITEEYAQQAFHEGQVTAIHRAQAVIEFDMTGNVVTANSNFLQTMGYNLEEIRGQHHSLFVNSEEAGSAEYQQFWQTLRNGDYISELCRRKKKNGDIVWLQATYNPILDPNGVPTKVVKFAMDITEQKTAEAQLKKLIGEASSVMEGVAKGDLTQRMEGNYSSDLMMLAHSINQTTSELRSVIGKVNANAQTLKVATDQLTQMYSESRVSAHKFTDNTLEIASAAKQISGNVSQVTEFLNDMTTSVDQVTSNSTEAAAVANKAVSLAANAKINVNQLSDSSRDIGAVIKVINSIADQTNLLALNATIEAARAGEAGKGFAVVANEVKELAKETAKATEEVSVQISAIQHDSQIAVKAINDIGSTIESINQSQTIIATNVESQISVTRDINHVFQHVSDGSNNIETTISEAAIAASENQSRTDSSQLTTTELNELADELGDLVSRFKIS